MSTIKDGGPAFPCERETGPRLDSSEGMSLRDYFAAAAMQVIEASQGNNASYVSTIEKVAGRAYKLADAMIKAREGGAA